MGRDLTREWIADLTQRCEEHLKANPEDSGQKFLPPVVGEIPYLATKNNIVATVEEVPFYPGAWRVLVNGETMQTWTGPDAHADALKFINDLLRD